MRNLEDPKIAALVKKAVATARHIGVTVPKTTEAAVQAYVEACTHPGSLVRVTSKTQKEAEDVLFEISGGDRNHGKIDWPKTADATDAVEDKDLKTLIFIVEFKNGSAIELRVGK